MAKPDSIVNLHQQLDTLWIRYLDLVDQYTQAQTSIKTTLGQGFFSLARANFTSSGRRYGPDYYDQRAIASTKAQFVEDGEMPRIKIISTETDVKTKKETATHLPTPEPEDEGLRVDSERDSTQAPTAKSDEDDHQEETAGEDQSRLPSDPLRQFGILIPPALRSAQKSFAKAVQDLDALSKAINSAREMRDVEMEIRKARKVLKKAERNEGGAVASGLTESV